MDLFVSFPSLRPELKGGDSRLLQSFYVLVDPTIRMVLGVGVISMVIVGNRLLHVSFTIHNLITRSQISSSDTISFS